MVRTNRSEIWNYFDNVVEEGVAVCKTCQQRLRNNRSFNLRQHMRKLHNIEVEAQENFNVHSPYSPQPYDEEQINAVLKAAKRKMHEERIFPDKRSRRRLYIEMDKKTIVRSVMGLMIDDGVSPTLFASKNMQNMLSPMYEAISDQDGREFKINASKCERAVSLVANHIRNDFSNDLHWRLLSLKFDTDFNASHKSFCVSALFVSEGQVETKVLGLINLKDNDQLSEKYIKEVLHKFNIDTNQIVAACFDNTKQKFKQKVTNSEYHKEIENFEIYPDIYVGDAKIERYIGVIAQLCLLDIFKNSIIFQPFLECRNLAKFINDKSNGYYEIFEKKNLKIPQLDSPWKWGSTYTMINDLHQARSVLENVKYEKLDCPEDYFNLNDNIWAFIESYCKVLNFLQKSILKFYSEELHFGDFYAQWLKSKLLTEKLVSNKQNKENFITIIALELIKCIEKRSNELLTQPRFEACLYLDPRFQHTLNLQQKANALEYLKTVWTRAKLYNANVVKSASSAMGQLSPGQQFDDDEDAFLNEFLSQDVQTKDTTTADVCNILERLKLPFQMVDTNILFFWREQKFSEPEMHALSSICFAMPATQIYSKIRYSYIAQNDSNSNLSAFTKDNLLFIRLNAHLLDDVIDQLGLFKEEKSSPLPEEEKLAEDKNKNAPSTSSSAAMTNIVSQSVMIPSTTAIVPPLPTTILTPISTAIVPPLSTAIFTPAGTAFLPPNITIKPVTTIQN